MNAMPENEHTRIVLQSNAETTSPEMLDASKTVIQKRLKALGLQGIKVTPDYQKGMLQIEFNRIEEDQMTPVLDVMRMEGELELLATYQHKEIFAVLKKAAPDLSEKLSGEDNGTSPVLGAFSPADATKIEQLLNQKKLRDQLPTDLKLAWGKYPNAEGKYELYTLRYEKGEEGLLKGGAVAKAEALEDQTTGQYLLAVSFDEEGKTQFAEGTKQNLNRAVAIVIDDLVYMAPVIKTPITGGQAHITGNFSASEVFVMSTVLENGVLPLNFSIATVTHVGK